MSLFDDEFDCRCRRKKKCYKPYDPSNRYMKRCYEKYGYDWNHKEDCNECNQSWKKHDCKCQCHKKRDCDCDCHKKHDCRCHKKCGCDCHKKHDCRCHKKCDCDCHKKHDCRCRKKCDCDCHKKRDRDCHKKHRGKCDGCACEVLRNAGRGVDVKVVTDSGQVIFGKFFGFDKDCCVTIKQNAAVCVDAVKSDSVAQPMNGDIVFIDCRKIESVTFISDLG